MGLQQFVRQTQNALPGDKIQAKEVANGGHAMIMWVREFKKGTAAKPLKTKFNPAGDAQLVTVDFVDLATNEIKLNVAFFNETISDQLRPYAEKDELSGETREAQPLPLKFVWVAPKDATGNAYI